MEQLFVTSILMIFLIVISIIDLRRGMIYDKILLPMAIIAIVFDLLEWLVPIYNAMIAAFIGGGLLLMIQILSRGGLGGGDVKFAFVLGLWLGVDGITIALFMSTIFASIVGIIIFLKRRTLKVEIPFGPFISMGGMTSFFFKSQILRLYESIINLP